MNHAKAFTVRHADWHVHHAMLAAIRYEVFVVEQRVPEEEEWDDLDAVSRHVVALAGDAGVGIGIGIGTGIGTGRLLPDGRIGRMAVLKAWRGRGVGSALLSALIQLARDDGHSETILHAQTHARAFYARHGYTPVGGEFMEAGIPHIEMRLRLGRQAMP